jgi:hypothetical protein
VELVRGGRGASRAVAANATVLVGEEEGERAGKGPAGHHGDLSHHYTPLMRLLRTNLLGLVLHVCLMAWWVAWNMHSGCFAVL